MCFENEPPVERSSFKGMLWRDLYASLVKPHLDYAVQAWSPHLQVDIDKTERVQRRATRIPIGFEKLEYEERLKRFSVTILNYR